MQRSSGLFSFFLSSFLFYFILFSMLRSSVGSLLPRLTTFSCAMSLSSSPIPPASSATLTEADLAEQHDILDFWFADRKAPRKTWFAPTKAEDEELARRFKSEGFLAGAKDHWKQEPRGRLALVLVLDQFTRQLFRGTPAAFSGDAAAVAAVLEGIDLQHDVQLPLFERLFFYMPLEHAEDRGLQVKAVELFSKVVEEAKRDSWANVGFAEQMLKYAEKHKVVIDRFGRYPHRNKVLGRESTAEETEFLTQPGSSFS